MAPPSKNTVSLDSPEDQLNYALNQLALELGAIPNDDFDKYRFNVRAYLKDKFGWQPWEGTDEGPGQGQVIDQYELCLRQQFARDAWEKGELYDTTIWEPGQEIQNYILCEAGHTVGKTKLASGLVNHFFDCFTPSIQYSFAPSWDQIHDLLWKEIKADRRNADLPGRILDLKLDRGDNHFATGRATSDAGGRGTERVQGQHGRYLMFTLDEAEGIPDFVYEAVKSMVSGGISVVLLLANPRTRTSRFHKTKTLTICKSFRISCLNHPNVVQGKEVVPGAVRRQYVESMIEEHCRSVSEHNEENYTFTVPWRPNVIYEPDAEFMFRVLGIAPANMADNTMVPVGVYEAAVNRFGVQGDPLKARLGVDAARYGKDKGTLYVEHAGIVWCEAQFGRSDTLPYVARIKRVLRQLSHNGVKSVHLRVDSGGGYAAGITDPIRNDLELTRLFEDFIVYEVNYNEEPYDASAYANKITEMYGLTAERLKALSLRNPPSELMSDLTERTFKWKLLHGVPVKTLQDKEEFKKDHDRSPDHGDGFVLAASPDYIFQLKSLYVLTHGGTRGWTPAQKQMARNRSDRRRVG